MRSFHCERETVSFKSGSSYSVQRNGYIFIFVSILFQTQNKEITRIISYNNNINLIRFWDYPLWKHKLKKVQFLLLKIPLGIRAGLCRQVSTFCSVKAGASSNIYTSIVRQTRVQDLNWFNGFLFCFKWTRIHKSFRVFSCTNRGIHGKLLGLIAVNTVPWNM